MQLGYHDSSHLADATPLEFKHVSVSYDAEVVAGGNTSHLALSDVSFEAAEGVRLAIVGPNGAGKSTLLKTAAGLVQPGSGQVLMHGNPSHQHTCIAYVPQRSAIDWSFPVTVTDVVMMGRARQIGFFRRPKASDREAVLNSLERVGAADLKDKPIGALSGGQQQRVFIARSLALETHLLLLDEPTNGLDATSQEMVLDLLDDLHAQGVTVIVVTHDLDVAASRFDEVMLLRNSVISHGSPEVVFTSEHLLSAYGGSAIAARHRQLSAPHSEPSP
jgi:ABC-type Mn2+/Zn2+ transport system ATPase subunit